jgi:tetratricopeptide (TPR) repeat protein
MKRARPFTGLMLAAAAALVTLASEPGPALAAPSPTEEARERFGRGVQLFHEGSLEAALAEFQKAHQLAPNYRLHYNIAQVQYELHNFVEALRSFWKYLAQGGNEIPADRKQQVEAEIRKLEKRVGYVTITTNVSGAQISVDGVPMGISPFTAPVLVNPGSRRVSANKAGYLPAVNTVTAAGGEKLSLTLNLMEGSVGAAALAARPSPFGGDVHGGTGQQRRTRTWISLAATGALVVSASAFAFVTRDAEDEFELELSRIPNTRETIEDSRSRMKRYAAITDALAAAAVVGAACTVYFALTDDGPTVERAGARPAGRGTRLTLSPTTNGLQVGGKF